MIGFLILLAGALAIYIGALNQAENWNWQKPEGYPDIPLTNYVIGMVVLSIPLAFMTRSPQWAWRYVALILVATALANYQGVAKFSAALADFMTN